MLQIFESKTGPFFGSLSQEIRSLDNYELSTESRRDKVLNKNKKYSIITIIKNISK